MRPGEPGNRFNIAALASRQCSWLEKPALFEHGQDAHATFEIDIT
jgi:hypothetical protein